MYTFDTFFLACYLYVVLSTVVVLSWAPKTTYRWTKILRKSYKSIHSENLDIGLGNDFNPKQSSKCTVFVTGFFTKVFFVCRGNAKFQVLFGDMSEKNHCPAKSISSM